jgi:hypothetical protein
MFDWWLCDAQRLAFELEWEKMELEWEKKDMEKLREQEKSGCEQASDSR